MEQQIIQKSLKGATWAFERFDTSDDVKARYGAYFAQQFDMPVVLGEFLAGRGITPDTIDAFLEPRLRDLLPNPSDFTDMDQACQILASAIADKKPIGIFGDYDVDGACSAAIFDRFLTALGCQAHIHIPDRFSEGYGPNIMALQSLKEAGSDIIITVDCGITAHQPLAQAEEMGMKVIVIDHHQASATLPRALAVVNPNRLDDTSGQGALCAAAMAFMTCVGTLRHLRENGQITTPPIDLLSLLDLVGMATICDVVPLTPVNRAFVKQGLKVLKQRQNVGLKHLADQARMNTEPTAYSFGFQLGPRINAGGRIGNAALGAKLLATKDSAIATSLALQLDDLNKQRKDVEAGILNLAIDQATTLLSDKPDTSVLIVHGKGWHEGVLGIVAGRLKDHFHRPAIAISFDEDGMGKGSARGIKGFSLGDTIINAQQSGLLIGGGGHAMAAGLSITQENLDDFTAFMIAAFAKQVGDLPPPSLTVSAQLPLSACQKSFVTWLEKCAPFGIGFSEPRLMLSSVTMKNTRWIGNEEQHFSCEITDGTGHKLRAIAFGLRDKLLDKEALRYCEGVPFHLAGKLKGDTYRGGDAVQFIIDDLAPSHQSYA